MSDGHGDKLRLADVEIDFTVEGPAAGTPLLMMMGLGMQRIAWPGALVEALVARGFRCIMFDNRDAGLSTRYEAYGVPSLTRLLASRLLHRRVALPYRLVEIADDAAFLLNHLGIARAHVLGISMGGMVAQHFAHRHPQRTWSLSLMATSSGRLLLPPPRPPVLRVLLERPRETVGLDAAIEYLVRLFTVIGSPGFPTPREELERRARAAVLRSPAGTGVLRQFAAIVGDRDRTPILRRLRAPTLVLHGDADPMLPPAHGADLARRIPGAMLQQIPGWGHDLPDALAEPFAARIAVHAAHRG